MKKLLNKDFIIYISKCLIGVVITYTLYVMFPQHQFFWSVISVLLSFSPEAKNARQVAYDRMKANILGSVVSIVIFMIHLPDIFAMLLGTAIIIILTRLLKIDSTVRTALAAVVIVLLYEQENHSLKFAFERMICVMTGCVIALCLTLLADILFYKDKRNRYIRKAKVVKKHYLKDRNSRDDDALDTN